MPPLKTPALGTHKFPSSTSLTSIKQESYKILNRISSHLFPPSANTTTSNRPNVLERRTIQSTQISTISSLVDKTKSETFSYDAQKENYGLYALKCNRNALKNGLIISVPPPSQQSFQSQHHSSSSFNSNDINHEKFLPCNQSTDIVSVHHTNFNHDTNFNSLNTASHGDFYKIEFNETVADYCSSSGRIPENNSKQFYDNTNGVVNNERNFSQTKENVRKVPPPRKKKFMPTLQSEEIRKVPPVKSINKMKAPSVPISTPHTLCVQKPVELQNNISLVASNNSSKLLMQKTNSDDFLIPMNNLKKNPSELYRIAEMKVHRSLDTLGTVLSAAPPVVSFATRSTTSVAPRAKRKNLIKQFSTTDSINIFEMNRHDDVFTDFNEVLYSVPVIPVLQELSQHRQTNYNQRVNKTPNECTKLQYDQVCSSINSSPPPSSSDAATEDDTNYISDRINLKSNPIKGLPPSVTPSVQPKKQDAEQIYNNKNKVNNEDDIVDKVVTATKEATKTKTIIKQSSVIQPAAAFAPAATPSTIMMPAMNNEPKLINNFQNSANINTNFQTKLHYANTTQQKPKQTDKKDMYVTPSTSTIPTTSYISSCSSSSSNRNSSSNIINSSNDCVTTIPHTQIITTDNNICYATTNKVMGISKSGTEAASGGICRRIGGNNNNNNYEVGCNKNDKMTTTTSTRSVYVMNLVTV